MSTAAMLGIVAALGVTNASATEETTATEPVSSVTVVVGPPTTAADAVGVPELSNQPIRLTAAPVIAAPPPPAPTQPAPVATTNGSR